MRSSFVAPIVALVLGLASACGGPPVDPVQPVHGRGQGGDWVWIRGEDFSAHGGLVVTFADIAARAVVIESERLIRVNTPTVPIELRGQPLPITLYFADGEQRQLDATYVFDVGRVQVQPRQVQPRE